MSWRACAYCDQPIPGFPVDRQGAILRLGTFLCHVRLPNPIHIHHGCWLRGLVQRHGAASFLTKNALPEDTVQCELCGIPLREDEWAIGITRCELCLERKI